MTTTTRKRTGRLSPLYAALTAMDRGSRTVHAAEEVLIDHHGGQHYPEPVALCGEQGWGAATNGWNSATNADLEAVNCGRCTATNRWRDRETAA